MSAYDTLPLGSCILGKKLDADYYATVQAAIQPSNNSRLTGPHRSGFFFAYGKRSALEELQRKPVKHLVGFTGRQDLSAEGWRGTHLIAQVVTALHLIPVSGHAYGADLAVEMGGLSKNEFSRFSNKTNDIQLRQLVVLPSGIRSRAPKHFFLDEAVVEQDGIFIALLPGRSKLATELLSPRDRLIVELSDLLIVTEAGVRGTMDTIHWAIELGRPIVAIKWNEVTEARTGWLILQELSREEPNIRMLEKMLKRHFSHQTWHYSFSPMHPTERAKDVPKDGSRNRPGYRSPAECAQTLVRKVKSNKVRIGFLEVDDVLPPHDGNQRKRNTKAANIRDFLLKFIQRI